MSTHAAMSVLEEASRVNDYFFVVGIDTDPLLPLAPDAQADEDRADGHPLKLRYQYVYCIGVSSLVPGID